MRLITRSMIALLAITAGSLLLTGCPNNGQPYEGSYTDATIMTMAVNGQLVNTPIELTRIREAENQDNFNKVILPLTPRSTSADGTITSYQKQMLGALIQSRMDDLQLAEISDAYIEFEVYLEDGVRDVRLYNENGDNEHLSDEGSNADRISVGRNVTGIAALAFLWGVINLDVDIIDGNDWCYWPAPYQARFYPYYHGCGPWWWYDKDGSAKALPTLPFGGDQPAAGTEVTRNTDKIVMRYGYVLPNGNPVPKLVEFLIDNDGDGIPNVDDPNRDNPNNPQTCTPAAITTQPVGGSITEGSSLTLSVGVSGTGPFSYQWLRNGVAIAGATNATFVANQGGTYSVRVTNACNTTGATSAVTTVTANPTGPGPCTGPNGPAQVTFYNSSTQTTQYPEGRHSVFFDTLNRNLCEMFVNWPGGEPTELYVVAFYPDGSTSSSEVRNWVVENDQRIPFEVNLEPLYRNRNIEEMRIGIALKHPTTSNPDSYRGLYFIDTGISRGFFDTGAELPLYEGLYVYPVPSACTPAAITTQPVGGSITEGSSLTLSVGVSGTGPFSYQWLRNGVAIAGATNATFVANQGGTYSVRVTNACNTTGATSAVTTVTVNPSCVPVTITDQPVGGSITEGSSLTLSVGVSGTGPFSYQWLRNGVAISGANGLFYTAIEAGSYSVRVTNACNTTGATSAVTTVTVNPSCVPVTITDQPVGGSITEGSSLTLSVGVSGTGPFSYQWLRNGVAIAGATNATFVANQGGTYSVRVTNACNTTGATSAVTTVTVNPIATAPTITSQPVSASREVGATVTFTVAATGTAPLQYQWQKGGININGATGPSHTIPMVALGDAGNYRCVVTNTIGNATSNVATLTVTEPIEESKILIDLDLNASGQLTFSARLSNGRYPTNGFIGIANESAIRSVGLELYYLQGGEPWLERQLLPFSGWPISGIISQFNASQRRILRFEAAANNPVILQGNTGDNSKIQFTFRGRILTQDDRVTDANGNTAWQLDLAPYL